MKYTKREERRQIEKAFKLLLVQHDLDLKKFCKRFDYSYPMVYQRITLNSIEHDFVNEMIHKLDKSLFLQQLNGKLVISRKF